MRLERLTTTEAARRKGCTRQGLILAINRGDIDAERVGRTNIVIVNRRFQEWTPDPVKQAARLKSNGRKKRKAARV